MTNPFPYHTFSSFLKARYGGRVYKVALNPGLGCPNRDGTLSKHGCMFCDEFESGHAEALTQRQELQEQFQRQVTTRQLVKSGSYKYMAYLQAGAGTHGSDEVLRLIYKQVRALPDVVAVSIATRPDCAGDEALDRIAEEFKGFDIWVELGVQSSNDATLQAIGRNHTFADVKGAVSRIKEHGFSVCTHAILGLPGESEIQVRKTAEDLRSLNIDGVKLHCLYVAKGSPLENIWRRGDFIPIDRGEYVSLVVDFLERTSPDTVVQRLVGRGRPEVHLAPDWVIDAKYTQKLILDEFQNRGTRQGLTKN